MVTFVVSWGTSVLAGSAEMAQKAKEDFYKRKNFWKGKAEAILAKRRFGAPQQVVLGFDEQTLRFSDQGDL